MSETIIYQIKPSDTISECAIVMDSHPPKSLIKLGYNELVNNLGVVNLLGHPEHNVLQPLKKMTVNNQLTEINAITGLNIKKIYSDITLKESDFKQVKTIKEADTVYLNFSEVDEINFLQANLAIIFETSASLSKGSNLIIKWNAFYTMPSFKTVYFLASAFKQTWCIKPIASSTLLGERFFVFENLTSKISDIKFTVKKGQYIIDVCPTLIIPNDYLHTIQCLNAAIDSQILKNAIRTKRYITKGVFHGDETDKLLAEQKAMEKKWDEMFIKSKGINEHVKNVLAHNAEVCAVFK